MSSKYSSQLQTEPAVVTTILTQPVGGSSIWTALGLSYYIPKYAKSIHRSQTYRHLEHCILIRKVATYYKNLTQSGFILVVLFVVKNYFQTRE